MKTVQLNPIGSLLEVPTGTRLLDGLLAKKLPIEMACGGRGLCATCHVYVRQGANQISPRSDREERTLSRVPSADNSSRLACQSHVFGEGIVVELPEGTYVLSIDQVKDLIGQKAVVDYLHPITGQLLIGKGKIITRTLLHLFVTVSDELRKLRESN